MAGVPLRFPIRYFDYPMIVAGFGAPTARVRKVLPTDKLKPVELAPGMAAVALTAMEYGNIDGLAPHNEFMILLSVMYEMSDGATGLHGYYILHTPVSTEEALRRGVDVYGSPKLLADIEFEETGEMRHCQVRAEGQDIISLDVKMLATEPQSWDMYFYTVKNGQLLRSLVRGQGHQGISGDEGGASFTLGSHPIAHELRVLEISEPSPLYRYSPQWQSIAYPPSERLPL